MRYIIMSQLGGFICTRIIFFESFEELLYQVSIQVQLECAFKRTTSPLANFRKLPELNINLKICILVMH